MNHTILWYIVLYYIILVVIILVLFSNTILDKVVAVLASKLVRMCWPVACGWTLAPPPYCYPVR
jgi:hypothetical protein